MFPFQREGSRANRTPAVVSPVWARWTVLVFALLFGTVATAQAAHLHAPAKAGHHVQGPAAGSSSADDEEHCPLCVAMHPALPATMHLSAEPEVRDEPLRVADGERTAGTAWHFARFGRPPPICGLVRFGRSDQA